VVRFHRGVGGKDDGVVEAVEDDRSAVAGDRRGGLVRAAGGEPAARRTAMIDGSVGGEVDVADRRAVVERAARPGWAAVVRQVAEQRVGG